jgi:hypothetical protein
MNDEVVVDRTERSEIVRSRVLRGFYGRCVAGCPWVGDTRESRKTARMDAVMHDDDPDRAHFHRPRARTRARR